MLVIKPYNSLDSLMESYLDIIMKAKDNGLNRLTITLLGLNSFKRLDSYNALSRVVMNNLDLGFNLTLNLYSGSRLLACSSLDGSECYIRSSLNIVPPSIGYSIKLNKIFNLMDSAEMLIPSKEIASPMAFIDEYMLDKGIKKSYLYANGFDKDECSKFRCGTKRFKMIDCYKAAIVLGLNRTTALQLISYAGYSFKPNDELDIWFNDYLANNELEPDMAHFQDKYYEEDSILSKLFI